MVLAHCRGAQAVCMLVPHVLALAQAQLTRRRPHMCNNMHIMLRVTLAGGTSRGNSAMTHGCACGPSTGCMAIFSFASRVKRSLTYIKTSPRTCALQWAASRHRAARYNSTCAAVLSCCLELQQLLWCRHAAAKANDSAIML